MASKPSVVHENKPIGGESFLNIGNWYAVVEDGEQKLSDIAKANEFISFALLDVSKHSEGRLQPEILKTDLDKSLLSNIASKGELGECSLFDVLKYTSVPFGWETGADAFTGLSNEGANPSTDDEFDIILNQYGINSGYCVPFTTADGTRYVVIYFGKKQKSFDHNPQLALNTIFIVEGIWRASFSLEQKVLKLLRPLERTCLEKVASGFSKMQISEEFGYNVHTIEMILNSAIVKLQSNSVAQAIAKAESSGEISVQIPT